MHMRVLEQHFVQRFPWVGFGALCGVFVCMGIAIVALLVSDDKSQSTQSGDHWPKWIAPSVILSGLNSVSSLLFSVAIAIGVAIAWWRQTLQGATIKELHKSWSFATSIKDVLLSGRNSNVRRICEASRDPKSRSVCRLADVFLAHCFGSIDHEAYHHRRCSDAVGNEDCVFG